MKLNQDIIRQIVNVIAIIAAFAVNVLANVRPIGGLTLGEISNNQFEQVLITPANYAFAIWGVIYLGLFSFAIYQALPTQQQRYVFRHQISYWLVVSSLAQIVWVFLFQLRLFAGSFLAMLLILLPLIRIYSQLDIGRGKVSRRQRWFVQVPIAIYFAWISVATIVNGAVSLTDVGWDGWGISPEVWTVIMMVGGGAIALLISIFKRDIAFTGVFLWALVAIAVRHWGNILLSGTAFLLAAILAAAIATLLYRRPPSRSLKRL
jgi:hypothetical protein